MKRSLQRALAVLVAAMLIAPVALSAQQERAAHHPVDAPKAADMADAEVRKIDKDAKKITLRHGEIKNLDMPPMTMVFQVKDPALLDKVHAGDKVRFRAEKIGSAYTVTAIEAMK